ELRRDLGIDLLGGDGLFQNVLVEQLLGTAGPEWRPAGDDLVGGRPEAVHVRPRVEDLSANLFGRHVAARAFRLALAVKEPRQTGGRLVSDGEVDQLHFAGAVDQNVVRLHVAVDVAFRVGK